MSTRTDLGRPAAALALALAAGAWVVAVRQMRGMDMGAATELGSFAFFAGAWVSMMLPGAIPAVVRRVRGGGGLRAAPLFAGAYLVVWAAVGLAVYVAYRPHSAAVAGASTIAAGLYELTPLKRRCRRRCREDLRSGVRFGVYCVGSSIGLMALLVALGAMSLVWMSVVAVLVLAQKLLPPRPSIDVPLALALVGLGIATAI
jgi:predicted metal-binding membrane protein